MHLTFSQLKLKPNWKNKINGLFNVVKTKATPDLWIKVFIYRNKSIKFSDGIHTYNETSCRGHYRWAEYGGHGFYDEEWSFIRRHPKIKHVITLKIGESCNNEDIARLIAHEYRHYLQFKKYGIQMNPKHNNHKRPVQVERDAEKWAKKRVDSLIGTREVKHKSSCDGFTYWVFCEHFARLFGV